MFSWLRRREKSTTPLTGAPPVRRQKSYSARSGYVYQYFYEGYRPFRAGGEHGTEFVFSVSSTRKEFFPVPVVVTDTAVRAWVETHGRSLNSTERYAVAKMALFQAFDERENPAQMKETVWVRAADIEAILETLGLD